jgi:hypothetical protein
VSTLINVARYSGGILFLGFIVAVAVVAAADFHHNGGLLGGRIKDEN